MAREHWRDEHHERDRRRQDPRDRDDFGQADYSTDYAYDPDTRSGYRAGDDGSRSGDPHRPDYTADWGYDVDRERPYRNVSEDYVRDDGRGHRSRSWKDRAENFFTGGGRHDDRRHHDEPERRAEERSYDGSRRHEDERRARRRRGSSDRVLWAVIMERLEDDRRIDLRDVDVIVEDGEVTLNGTVRRKEDKRRIEDIADIDGVHNVQNNLRQRDRDRGWTFL